MIVACEFVSNALQKRMKMGSEKLVSEMSCKYQVFIAV